MSIHCLNTVVIKPLFLTCQSCLFTAWTMKLCLYISYTPELRTVENFYNTIGELQEIGLYYRRIEIEYHDLAYSFHDDDHIAQMPHEPKFQFTVRM